MSLINDALKRARETQAHEPATPASSPQLRPVDPPQEHHVSPIYFIIGMGLLVIVLGLLLVWQMAQRRDLTQRVQARSQETQVARNPEPQPAPVTATPAATAIPKPVAAAPITTANPEPAPASSASVPATTPKNIEISAAAPQATTAPAPIVAAPIAPEPPKPAPLKLQGITFHPTRPAAMISGRTLFIGDRTGEWRLIAITQNAATLVSGSHTNVLTLPE
jgi:hypothetical protein